ncbi:MAG: DNA polymerase III subunit delta [Epulopiscium sp.]|nr:DNA polymerase III subunit delta [Candidatus Epulonipiscium sp.]HOQ16146.1 DNA polymerase III subunit delta [Defluviitaleaceae bacterium]HPT75375.1 DNA polymerase III subunit delta [Defluviitaleaceae bacterium]
MLNYYLGEIQKKLIPGDLEIMNMSLFEGEEITANQVIESAQALPFMNDKRLVIIKNSGFFTAKRKKEAELILQFLDDIPPFICLVFAEENVDKKNKLYKKLSQMKAVVEFQFPKEQDLLNWIEKKFKKYNKEIDRRTSLHLVRTVGRSMIDLENEINKLIAYKEDKINIEDIDKICVKSLEAHIFDLLKAIGYKKTDEALQIYVNLIRNKEAPIKILTMLTRQIRLILQVKYLSEQGYNAKKITETIQEAFFVVNECLKQAQLFSMDQLKQGLKACLEADLASKTGKMDPGLAVEVLIIEFNK